MLTCRYNTDMFNSQFREDKAVNLKFKHVGEYHGTFHASKYVKFECVNVTSTHTHRWTFKLCIRYDIIYSLNIPTASILATVFVSFI